MLRSVKDKSISATDQGRCKVVVNGASVDFQLVNDEGITIKLNGIPVEPFTDMMEKGVAALTQGGIIEKSSDSGSSYNLKEAVSQASAILQVLNNGDNKISSVKSGWQIGRCEGSKGIILRQRSSAKKGPGCKVYLSVIDYVVLIINGANKLISDLQYVFDESELEPVYAS